MIDWLCLKPPKIKDQNSGSQLMLMRVTLEKPQRDGSYNFRQTNFKDISRIFLGKITVFQDD